MSDKPLDKMTVKELREIAKEIPDVTGISSLKKDDLIALISKSQSGAQEEPKEVVQEEAQAESKETAEKMKEAAPEETQAETEEAAEEAKEAAPEEAEVETKEAAQEEEKPVAKKKQKAAPKKAAKSTPKKSGKLETAKDFKEAVASLREQKQKIQQSASKKEIKILRRRMNRLKKRSRKVNAAA